MATQPTNLPVPSESPRDLKFNAGKIDEFVTSLVNTYVDRFGNEHYTIEGLRWLAQQAIAQYGWILIDSFRDGANITLPNQALRDEDTGEYYRWDGALPKHVDAGSTPSSSGGVGVGAWVGIGDASLRAMLATSAGAGMIGALDSDGNATTVQNAIGHYRAYTVKERLDEEISIASIPGVDSTGTEDSTAALQNFFDSLSDGSEVYVPAGTYKISGLIISNNSLKIRGAYRYAYGQSTTKLKASAPNITLMKFTGNGCRVEGLLFEGYEAAVANEFGKGTTCKGVNFEPSTGTLADIDSFVDDCIFWYLQTGAEGHGRNLTVTNTMFTFCRFGVDLYGVPNQQFRGHIINHNRFHSCGGVEASSEPTLLNSVCIRLTTTNTNNVDNYAGNVSIMNNVVDGGSYQFFKGPFHRGSIMSANSMFRIGGSGAIVIDIDNTSTAGNTSSDGVIISDNSLGGFDLPVYQNGIQYCPDMGIRLTQVRGAILSENLINKAWKDGIKLVSSSEVIITGVVKDPSSIANQSTSTLYSSVDIDANCANVLIPHLMTRTTVYNGNQLAAYVKTACASTVIGDLYGSASYTPSGPVIETGSGYAVGDVSAVSSKTKITAITGLISGSNYPAGNYKPVMFASI